MDTEHLSGARLWTLAVLALLFYGIIGVMGFRSWQARHEAKIIIAAAEKYRQLHGQLPDCDSDFSSRECERLGLDQPDAFYERKTGTRYVVDYFGFLGMTRYDSATGGWDTAYWWAPNKFSIAR